MDLTANDRETLNATQKDAVREQLNRLLASPFFRQSKRLPKLLCFVIEQTLADNDDVLKERTLGVEIFGREADYETATDPIVRVTVAEIRKRIAQYYQESGREGELRITLPLGSYTPKFEWPSPANENGVQSGIARLGAQDSERTTEPENTVLAEERSTNHDGLDPIVQNHFSESESNFETPVMRRSAYSFSVVFVTLFSVGLLATGTALFWRSIHRSPIGFFWGPVVKAHEVVLICAGDQIQDAGVMLRDTTDPSHSRWFADTQKRSPFPTVGMDHVNVIVKLAAILQSSGAQYALKGEESTNLADLRAGPVVLIGAFDNVWTLRLTNALRFRFANDPDLMFPRIIDSADASKPSWATNQSQVGSKGSYRDFAIVARFTDSDTGKLAVIVAGIGRCGSLAAGQFISDAADLAGVERAARAAGNKRNMELVLSTDVIDGQPGSPKVEAAYFW